LESSGIKGTAGRKINCAKGSERKQFKFIDGHLDWKLSKNHTEDSPFWDITRPPNNSYMAGASMFLSNQWPLDFFSGRLSTHMKTGFILITSWDFDLYRLPQFGDNFMEV
jgi:hypothetical protein